MPGYRASPVSWPSTPIESETKLRPPCSIGIWHAGCFARCGATTKPVLEVFEMRGYQFHTGVGFSPPARWPPAWRSCRPPRPRKRQSRSASCIPLSGTMAISETTLKDVMLMLIEEQNAKGGLLGRQLEAVVVDPASRLAALCRARARTYRSQRRRGRIRLLDIGVPQGRAAGLRGAEQPASSTPSSTKARKASATCSTHGVPPPTSRPSRPSNI